MGSGTRGKGARRETLSQIATGIVPASGPEFFPLLVHHLARALDVSCALVGEFDSVYDGVLTRITADVRGRLSAGFNYPLENSPFENATSGGSFVYPERVREKFPDDRFLAEMGIESCAATRLHDSEGRVVGLLAVLSENAERDPGHKTDVLEFLAPRAGGEIQRRRTEEALRLTQFSVDRGGDPSFCMGPDGRFLYVNDAACRVLGYTRSELCAMSVSDIDPHCTAEVWPGIWEKVQEKKCFTLESLHRRKGGATFPVEITANYLEFDGSEYNWSFARDISQRRRAEALVAGQSRVLELIASGAALERTLTELTRVIEEHSQEAAALICLIDESHESLRPAAGPSLPGTLLEAIQKMPVGEGEGACAAAAHRRELVVVEDVAADPDCSKHRDLLLAHGLRACWSSPILSSRGKPLGTLAMFYSDRRRPGRRDLTLIETASHLARVAIERKQDEESLRLSSERFRHLIERMPEGVIVHRFGPIVYANPKAAQALGYDRPEELLGRSVADLVEPEQHRSVNARVQKMYETRKPAPAVEMRIVRKDGKVTIAEMEAIPIEFDGQPAVVTIARDLTDRKRRQARMLQADRMASVGTLAAGVAHEINNPLAYVISNLDYLTREVPSLLKMLAESRERKGSEANGFDREGMAERLDEIDATVEDAREGAERVRQIVRDLRTFSRDGDGERCAVDAQEILASSINMARREIEKRGKLVLSLDPIPPVQASESRLGQVFLNLLLNAAQALPEDRAEQNAIHVRTRPDGDKRVIIEVEDSGVGIPPENLDQIFQPFFTTKPVGVGTGLGLSICQNIIASLGGEISVKSRVGSFTRFTLSLPASPAAVNGESHAPPEAAGEGRSTT